MILEADKGKKFVVVDEETYLAMGCDHICKDKPVSSEEVRSSQAILTSTARSLINILGTGMGQSHSNYSRCMDNASSKAEDPPTMKILPKIHKDPTPQGHPQSRPVVTAATDMSSRVGDVLSDIIEPVILLATPRFEDKSTEEAISQLEEAATAIKNDNCKGSMVGSLDVRSLYLSMDQQNRSPQN